MHNYIYQLSKTPINGDEFIDEKTFEPEQVSDFSDYVDEVEELDEVYENFPFAPIMFDRDGEKLTYKGCNEVFLEWYKTAEEYSWAISEDGLKDSTATFRLRNALEEPFTRDRFVLSGWDDSPEPSSDFLQYCAKHLKKGDVLYLGGVLDFHW